MTMGNASIRVHVCLCADFILCFGRADSCEHFNQIYFVSV